MVTFVSSSALTPAGRGPKVGETREFMSSDARAAQAPSPSLVFDTLFAYQRTAALRAAIELDLFRAIGEGPGDVASIARRSSASERGTRILCDFLTVIGLLKKVRAALKPGGRVAALEFVPNEDRVSPPMAASFSLTMLATTAGGDAYTLSELEAMYRPAGFDRITAHPVPTGPHTVVVGRAA